MCASFLCLVNVDSKSKILECSSLLARSRVGSRTQRAYVLEQQPRASQVRFVVQCDNERRGEPLKVISVYSV